MVNQPRKQVIVAIVCSPSSIVVKGEARRHLGALNALRRLKGSKARCL